MTTLVSDQGIQSTPCPANFSIVFQTEILSKQTSDFLKQIIILKSLHSFLFTSHLHVARLRSQKKKKKKKKKKKHKPKRGVSAYFILIIKM